MNPTIAMKFMGMMNKFTNNHPKFVAFFKTVFSTGIPEGTIIEITVTKPGQEPITSNMRVNQEDLEMMESLKELASKGN